MSLTRNEARLASEIMSLKDSYGRRGWINAVFGVSFLLEERYAGQRSAMACLEAVRAVSFVGLLQLTPEQRHQINRTLKFLALNEGTDVPTKTYVRELFRPVVVGSEIGLGRKEEK